jgi:hypothetical protein
MSSLCRERAHGECYKWGALSSALEELIQGHAGRYPYLDLTLARGFISIFIDGHVHKRNQSWHPVRLNGLMDAQSCLPRWALVT